MCCPTRVEWTQSLVVPYGSMFCRFFWLCFEYALTIDFVRHESGSRS